MTATKRLIVLRPGMARFRRVLGLAVSKSAVARQPAANRVEPDVTKCRYRPMGEQQDGGEFGDGEFHDDTPIKSLSAGHAGDGSHPTLDEAAGWRRTRVPLAPLALRHRLSPGLPRG